MPDNKTIATAVVEDIPRSATRRTAGAGAESRALSAWLELDAFVLLAEPGGGKSRAFELEAKVSGGAFVTARTFANLGPPQGWHGETLFIDGLDEMRADGVSRNGPLDAVIQQLNALGRPRFRLSCREADWLVAVDHEALRAVAPGRQLEALYLDPLNDEEVIQLLSRRADRISDPAQFREEAEKRNMVSLLRNPLLLNLLVEAVGENWPRGRADVYRRACERMAVEDNQAIQAARAAKTPPRDQVLHDAGLLCAVWLLAGLDALVDGTGADAKAEVSIQALPSELGVVDAGAALSSKLFIAEGRRRFPRHRSVAEYLAAFAIGRQVTQGGLPISRVLALMSGFDGGIVEPLRGLNAWLAVACPSQRANLIERDPLACVLYGDAHAFSREDKRRVLVGLRREAERFVWFRRGNWAAHPFGALGTVDMAPDLTALLNSTDRSPTHQSLLDCVLDAIGSGEPLPGLLPQLTAIVRDATYRYDVRSSALESWLAQSGANLSPACDLLGEIQDGTLHDPRDEIFGCLLNALYPKMLAPTAVMRYFRISKTQNFFGSYRHFWSAHLISRTPEFARPLLADTLAAMPIPKDALHEDFELQGVIAKVIAAALDAAGASVGVARAAEWLAVGLDEYGSSALMADHPRDLCDWLARHPDVQKALIAHRYARQQPHPDSGRFYFGLCDQILYRARRPRDWYRWLLAHAACVDSPPLAEYCFCEAANAVLLETSDFDIDVEEVEHWVEANQHLWPQAGQWLQQVWSLPLDHSLGKQHLHVRERQAQQAAKREQRRAALIEHLADIETGRAWPCVIHDVALAYRGPFADIRGETPQARVAELLGGDAVEAARAIAGLETTLGRADLPTVAEILAADLEQWPHYLRAACLLGAELTQTRDVTAALGWTDDLVRRLTAFRLADGTGEDPAWYKQLIEHRPGVVAEVLDAYARQCLLCRAEHSTTGLWFLARDGAQEELARIVVPPLLRDFPPRARPAQLRRLNTELLPAAVRHVPQEEFKSIINERLAIVCLDSGQRMAWLVVGMRFAAHRRSRELAQLVGMSRVRALRLGGILDSQSDHAKVWPNLPAAALSRLVEVMAPHTTPDFPLGAGWVGPREHLRDIVHGLIHQLATVDDESAATEMERLREQPGLSRWKNAFDAALFDRARSVRSARYSHASAEAVANALSGQAPANALDLAALVIQHLQGLQGDLCGDDTNRLQDFWRDATGKKKRRQPQIENKCRDLLLPMLRSRLQLQGVSLHKEASHANDTRADLRAEVMVAGRPRKVVPIEIKKQDHPELWTAWHDQLEGRYMTDPAAEGVGIYLVLWFGKRPWGKRLGVAPAPASAKQLEESLIALIPLEGRDRLQVCVLDLSLPLALSTGKKVTRKAEAQRKSDLC